MAEPTSIYEKFFKDPKREPVLIDHVRTPMGKKRGTIGRHRGDDLIIHCYETLLKRNDFDKNIAKQIGNIFSINMQQMFIL